MSLTAKSYNDWIFRMQAMLAFSIVSVGGVGCYWGVGVMLPHSILKRSTLGNLSPDQLKRFLNDEIVLIHLEDSSKGRVALLKEKGEKKIQVLDAKERDYGLMEIQGKKYLYAKGRKSSERPRMGFREEYVIDTFTMEDAKQYCPEKMSKKRLKSSSLAVATAPYRHDVCLQNKSRLPYRSRYSGKM